MFVGLAVDLDLSDHGRDVGRVGREQMNPGNGPVAGAAHGLAVEAQLVPEIGAPGRDPAPQSGFDGGDVEPTQEVGECRLARGLGGPEPQGVSQRGAVVARELGNGFQRAHARERGDDHEIENHRERVPAPRRITRIGNRGQNFRQRGHGFHTGLRIERTGERIPGLRPTAKTNELNGPGRPGTRVAFTPDGRYMAKGTADGTVDLFRVAEKRS
jgi:hypothetical protein